MINKLSEISENGIVELEDPIKKDVIDVLSQEKNERLEEHAERVEKLGLHLDEKVNDGITTTEYIRFSPFVDKIEKSGKILSRKRYGGYIFAVNLGQYLFYGNPRELLGSLSSYTDRGIIFTAPGIKWNNGKSQSTVYGDINIIPEKIINAGQFFRQFGYNEEEREEKFGSTIRARKRATKND